MNQPTKTMREILVERGGRARALDPDDVMETIQELLKAYPDMIEELAPGMTLKRQPLTTKERAKRMQKASAVKRAAKAQKRYDTIVPKIANLLEKNPAITLRQIADVLDRTGPAPTRADRWSAASVQYIMKKNGLLNEPSKT